jgi:RNA polymerase sigma-70 factor (ECF subfamily)
MKRDSNMEDIFVNLVVEHQMELRAFVVSMMPGSADVDDVMQEANKVLWKKRGEFEIGTSFKAWMFSVAKF